MSNRQRAQQLQQQQSQQQNQQLQQQHQQLQYQQYPDNPHLPGGHVWIPTEPSMSSAFEEGLPTREPEDEAVM